MIKSLELIGESEFEPCPCCGQKTRRVWGSLFNINDDVIAHYYVTWNPIPCTSPASCDFIVIEVGEDEEEEGVVLSLEYRNDSESSGFRLIDGQKSYVENKLADRTYSREEIKDREEMRQFIIHACDFLFDHDPRIEGIETLSI